MEKWDGLEDTRRQIIQCIDTYDTPNITKGKFYEIIGETYADYLFVDDSGQQMRHSKWRFEEFKP